ncbi:MAG: hypothetical protein AB4041_05695 [Microcystaceae cyanobacterium]
MTNSQSTTETTPQTNIPETVIEELKQQYQENLRLIEEKYQTLLADKEEKLASREELIEFLKRHNEESIESMKKACELLVATKEETIAYQEQEITYLREKVLMLDNLKLNIPSHKDSD